MDRGAWKAAVHGVAEGRTRLNNFTFTFCFHALEKEMATHSSVLAWRIPGAGKPGGLPSMGSHRVGHDWSDLAITNVNQKCITCYIEDSLTILFLISNNGHLCLTKIIRKDYIRITIWCTMLKKKKSYKLKVANSLFMINFQKGN